jgi:hypothetical protein
MIYFYDVEGEWEKFDGVTKRHGRGVYQEGENRYEGEWKEDKIWGKGVFLYATGAIYDV